MSKIHVTAVSFLSWAFCLISTVDAQTFWQQATGLTGGFVTSLAADQSGLVVAGSYGGGIYLSTDDGLTWVQSNSGLTSPKIQSLVLDGSGSIYAGADSAGVFKSTDHGAHWNPAGLAGKSVHALVLARSGSLLAGVGYPGVDSGGVFRSTDGGSTWNSASVGLTSAAIRSLGVDSSGHLLAGSGGDGLYRSGDDGSSWTRLDLMGSSVTSVFVNNNGDIYAGTFQDGVFISSDGGGTWGIHHLENKTVRGLAGNPDGIVFGGTYIDGLYRTDNGGACWSSIDLNGRDVRALLVTPTGSLLAGTEIGVFRTLTTVRKIMAIDQCSLSIDSVIVPISTSSSDSFAVHNVTASSITIDSVTVTDRSYSINPPGASIPGGGSVTFTITFAPKRAGSHPAVISVFSSGTAFPEMFSLQGWAKMANVAFNYRSISFPTVAVGNSNDTVLTISNPGNDTLLITNIQSADSVIFARQTVFKINPGSLARVTIRFRPIDAGAVTRLLSVVSNALTSPDTFRVSGTGVTVTDVGGENGMPRQFALSQNYPNPFNPSTTFGLMLPKAGHVTLKIFNVLGEEISTPVDEVRVPGRYAIRWDAGEQPSGVYYAKILITGEAGDPLYHAVRKLMLTK